MGERSILRSEGPLGPFVCGPRGPFGHWGRGLRSSLGPFPGIGPSAWQADPGHHNAQGHSPQAARDAPPPQWEYNPETAFVRCIGDSRVVRVFLTGTEPGIDAILVEFASGRDH